MAALDKSVARRVAKAVERFAETAADNVKKLHDVDPRKTVYGLETGAPDSPRMRTRSEFFQFAIAVGIPTKLNASSGGMMNGIPG